MSVCQVQSIKESSRSYTNDSLPSSVDAGSERMILQLKYLAHQDSFSRRVIKPHPSVTIRTSGGTYSLFSAFIKRTSPAHCFSGALKGKYAKPAIA